MASVLEVMEKELPAEMNIAMFGIDYQHFPYWGRRFQFRPVRMDINGRPYKTFYHIWKENPGKARFWSKAFDEFVPESFMSNLNKTGIDYVLTSKLKKDSWPQQQIVLEKNPNAKTIYEDSANCLWQIDKSTQSE